MYVCLYSLIFLDVLGGSYSMFAGDYDDKTTNSKVVLRTSNHCFNRPLSSTVGTNVAIHELPWTPLDRPEKSKQYKEGLKRTTTEGKSTMGAAGSRSTVEQIILWGLKPPKSARSDWYLLPLFQCLIVIRILEIRN